MRRPSGLRRGEERLAAAARPTGRLAMWFALAVVVLALLWLAQPGGPVAWRHDYAPLAAGPLPTSLIALAPSILLFVLLVAARMRTSLKFGLSLAATFAIAVAGWGMPADLAASSVLFGMAVGVFPIFWTLQNAIWIFHMLVESGCFETLKQSLRAASPDRRMQTILVGYGLTALLESMAAFGAPLAIITATLAGLGFPPLLSATLALLADSTPSAWGTQSLPILMLGSVTGLDVEALGRVVGSQMPVVAALLPLGLVYVMSGSKGLRGVWPVALLVGAIYGAAVVVVSHYVSVLATGMMAGVAAILGTLLILRFWQPKHAWLFEGEAAAGDAVASHAGDGAARGEGGDRAAGTGGGGGLSAGKTLQAWSPYLALILIVLLINVTGSKPFLDAIGTVEFAWPRLDGLVLKAAPVVEQPAVYAAVYRQSVLTSGGTLMFLTGVISAFTLRMSPQRAVRCYIRTFRGILESGIIILCILGIAYLMNYSAMTFSVGLALAAVGRTVFPVVAVLLGTLGCVLAGSVAGGNALFGNLAVVVARSTGLDPTFIAGALCSGGTMGKPLTPQNLVIASAAMGHGKGEGAGKLLARVAGMTAAYTVLLVLWVFVQHRVLH